MTPAGKKLMEVRLSKLTYFLATSFLAEVISDSFYLCSSVVNSPSPRVHRWLRGDPR
jgi:hypothetical protein